ncbi:MAG: 6-hydroxymethylpterin diphosphokinase MptE-like protein, partial [Methanotrichaceae archaeon]
MRFDLWQPIYQQILDDFGFSQGRDQESTELLSRLLRGSGRSLEDAFRLVRGRTVVVCGNGPSLNQGLDALPEQDHIFIAADGATETLINRSIIPQIIVTDLDGPFYAILQANELGSIIVVHAHGDNIDATLKYVPQLNNVIGTTQSRPLENIYNFGGFTDGDRCVFLAKHLGASEIKLVGFDYDDESVTPRKRKKLSWAKRLIEIALSE